MLAVYRDFIVLCRFSEESDVSFFLLFFFFKTHSQLAVNRDNESDATGDFGRSVIVGGFGLVQAG